jgi:hypothetical protein
LGFPTGWSFTTHKDLLLHVNYMPAASFLAPSPSSKYHEGFSPLIYEAWQGEGKPRNLAKLQAKISIFAGHLEGWGRLTFGHVRLELSKLKEELINIQEDSNRLGPMHADIKIIDQIVEFNHREQIMWQWHSRVQWMAVGDKNTKFFHLRASERKNKNKSNT